MKLIVENTNNNLNYIIEKNDKNKMHYISGVFMQAESKNRNGRIYKKAVLEHAVDEYNKAQVKTGRAVGELNHPLTPTVNLDRVSHRIVSLNFEGNNVIGKALVLNTPMGKIVQGLLEGGVKLGVSSRGLGSVITREGVDYVNDDFMLSTIDIVQDPSAPDAFVNGIMENTDWFKTSNNSFEAISKVNEQKRLRLFKQFLKTL